MSGEYRNNHYVPVWYQKRFLPPRQRDKELYYLDLKPDTVTDSRGRLHTKNAVHRLGFRHCFAAKDLYTTRFGSAESTEIEQLFFGPLDAKGRESTEYFTHFEHPSVEKDAFQNALVYMSTQKLRTPKGLGGLMDRVGTTDQDVVLQRMLGIRQLHCAVWTECVWLIADSSQTETKLIISDHPVTVYNRRCGPRSMWCRGYNDPDIGLHGTHTIFALSMEKVLILTNLSWVRKPYQSEVDQRPNPQPWRTAMFNFMEIQTRRHLSEQEVREINFIIKSRALRYVAAARPEWLYPEKFVSKSQWNVFGDGYLLMPDPRGVRFGGEIVIRYRDGRATSFDAYGRRPWQPGYNREFESQSEFSSLQRFQGEFARLYGPRRRGRSFAFMQLDPETDDEDFHRYHLGLEEKYKHPSRRTAKPGPK